MPEEQRIRLARFLPKLDTGAVPPLDNLLAKAFTVRSSRQQNGGGAVHVYRSGRQVTHTAGAQEGESASTASTTTKEDAPEGEAEAAQLLDAGDALLAQSQISEAFLTYFEIVNTYPDSAASIEVDAALNGLLWDADRGIADTAVLRTLADQLPAYGECASDKAVYWLTALQQVTGSALKRSGQQEAAVPYLQTGRDLALAAMTDFPASPYQVFIPGQYMLACRDLGWDELNNGIAQLNLVVAGQETNSILKFAARHSLATTWNRDNNDIIEGGMQVASIVDEYPGSVPEQTLIESTTSPNIRAHLELGLGYVHYQMAHFGKARRYFESGAAHRDNARLADTAAYMAAHMIELADQDQTETVLNAYYGYMASWPDGLFLDKALMRIASVFRRTGRLSDAAGVYRDFLELFPDSPWNAKLRKIAEDTEAAIAAGMEERLRGDTLITEYGTQWCGPYALAVLLESQGKEANLRTLAEESGMGPAGTSLAGLQVAAAANGLTVYAQQVSGAAALTVPAIAHLTPGHFVFVSAVSDTDITVEDLSGPRTVAHADFDALFSGYALALQPPDANSTVGQSVLEGILGGQDTWYTDLYETYMYCINQDCPQECPTNGEPSQDGGAGTAPDLGGSSKGTNPPAAIHNASGANMPGAMSNPGNPTVQPNIAFGGKSMDVRMGTNHRALSIKQTDFSIPLRGTLDLSFKRVYYNPWGKHRYYEQDEGRPFKNNIGNGWRHNFNVHVRLSSANGYLAYVDAEGNFKRFSRTDQNVNGYDLYQRAPEDMEDEDINALRTERPIRARRHVQDGWVEIIFPDGITCRFSAPINAQERYCRLEWFEDVSDNRVTLVYVTDDYLQTEFGRLSRVNAPTGDDRYLQFYYSGNRISSVELLKPDGAGTEVIKKVDFTYGPRVDGAAAPNNFLRAAEIDDNADDTVYFEYARVDYDPQTIGMYPSKITDKEGNQLLIECAYGQVPGNTFISTTEIELTYPDGLTTVFDKTDYDTTDVSSYDGQTRLSRFVYELGAHGVRVDDAKYYPDPNSAGYDNWHYGYENNFDLTSVGNVAVQYWYNADGRVTKYYCGYVYYRYEYPTGGGFYPIKQYGPGTANETDKGPMTEFVYDSYNRLTQVKPPDMGSNGITIGYDAYGQMTSRTNAAGDTESYTYDGRGNMTSHTDYENNTTTYTYDDLGRVLTQTDPANRTTTYTYSGGCSSCGGASGQIASITLPDNRQMFFDYDNMGNLVLQTDPMGHETTYEYDAMGRLVSVLTEEGREQTFAYDALGNMTSKTDSGGKTTYYEYDYRGLMTRTWVELGATEDTLVENEYNICGWLMKVTDGKGQDINFTYNERGQVTRTSHGEWCTLLETCDFGAIHIWNDYDQYGRLWRTRGEKRTPTVDIYVDPIEYFYNTTTGQLTKKRTTNVGGTIVRDVDYTYDVNGKLSRADDWAGGSGSDGHGFAYDDNGRLETYTDYDDAQLTYTYDVLGRPVTMNAYETGNSYGYAYNTAGQLSTITAPGNRQWGFTYDNGGKLSNYTWPNGQRTEYTYDNDGRLTALVHKDGPSSGVRTGWEYVLGDDGNILRMIDARSAYQADREYEYDQRDRLIRANWLQSDGSPQLRMTYTYDAADNMLSQTRHSYTSRVYDTFADGDYTSSPAWTVESGTWSAASNALLAAPATGERAIYTANTYGDTDAWWSFQRTDTGGMADGWLLQLRYVDANNYLGVRWIWGLVYVVECVNGAETVLSTAYYSATDEDTWYDLYVQMDGTAVVLFACKRGETLKRIEEVTTTLGTTTNRLRLRVNGVMPFAFDDFRVCSRSINTSQSMTFTYGPANQLATMTMAGVTTSYTYDPWGRLATRSAVISGQTYTATYTYWFGDKLKRIDSNFPSETAIVEYNYDGLGKRRIKAVGSATTYWRWDAGYSVLAQYQDDTADWGIGAFKRFFIPFGHTALAEADLDTTGLPANAVYTYLAQDHLGTSMYGFNQSKTALSQNIHLPFGQRSYTSGSSPYHEFTGKPWDAEAQMYYFPYRLYSPNMNRWTTPDPAGLVDGPNIYVYVRENPIFYVDQFGQNSTLHILCEVACHSFCEMIAGPFACFPLCFLGCSFACPTDAY